MINNQPIAITKQELEKIRDDRQHEADNDEKQRIRHKVRKSHEPDTAEQWNESLLPFTENKVRQTDRAKNDPPNQRSFARQSSLPFPPL